MTQLFNIRIGDRKLVMMSLIYPITLGFIAGIPGVLVGVLATGTYLSVGSGIGFLLAQFAFILRPIGLETAVVVEFTLAVPVAFDVVMAYNLRWKDWGKIAALGGLLLITLTTIVFVAPWPLLPTALAGLALAGGVMYGIHRYEIVTLGLVSKNIQQ